jgi:predicted DCC family thiol-disulfide oxidoreductase YuxK
VVVSRGTSDLHGLAPGLLRCAYVNKPVLVYDAACEFCRRWVARSQARTGDRVAYLPLQGRHVLSRFGIPRADALRASQLVLPDGRRYAGAEAVFRALEHAPEVRGLARAGRLPVVRRIAELVYRQVASHRALAARLDRLLFGRSTVPPGARIVRELFVRALGGVYLIAFTSLGSQVKGLYGERGIRPVREYLDALRETVPPRARIQQRLVAARTPHRGS